MKRNAQILCTVLFISIVAKSFFMKVNAFDGVVVIIVGLIFSLYEVLTKNSLKKSLEDHKVDNDKKIEQLQKELLDTKNYMSKISAGQALRK